MANRRGRWAVIVAMGSLISCGKSAEALIAEGEAAIKAMRWEDATEAYRQALALEPDNPAALYGMGWTLHLRQERTAKVYFDRCVTVAPQDYRCHKGLGSLYLSAGLYELAEAQFKEALALQPEEAGTYVSLGHLYAQTHRLELARKVLGQAIELAGSRGEPRYVMAEFLAEHGERTEALEQLEQALAGRFDEPRFRLMAWELKARLKLQDALTDPSAASGAALSEEQRRQRLASVAEGELAAAEALKVATGEDRARLFQLERKLSRARGRLEGKEP